MVSNRLPRIFWTAILLGTAFTLFALVRAAPLDIRLKTQLRERETVESVDLDNLLAFIMNPRMTWARHISPAANSSTTKSAVQFSHTEQHSQTNDPRNEHSRPTVHSRGILPLPLPARTPPLHTRILVHEPREATTTSPSVLVPLALSISLALSVLGIASVLYIRKHRRRIAPTSPSVELGLVPHPNPHPIQTPSPHHHHHPSPSNSKAKKPKWAAVKAKTKTVHWGGTRQHRHPYQPLIDLSERDVTDSNLESSSSSSGSSSVASPVAKLDLGSHLLLIEAVESDLIDFESSESPPRLSSSSSSASRDRGMHAVPHDPLPMAPAPILEMELGTETPVSSSFDSTPPPLPHKDNHRDGGVDLVSFDEQHEDFSAVWRAPPVSLLDDDDPVVVDTREEEEHRDKEETARVLAGVHDPHTVIDVPTNQVVSTPPPSSTPPYASHISPLTTTTTTTSSSSSASSPPTNPRPHPRLLLNGEPLPLPVTPTVPTTAVSGVLKDDDPAENFSSSTGSSDYGLVFWREGREDRERAEGVLGERGSDEEREDVLGVEDNDAPLLVAMGDAALGREDVRDGGLQDEAEEGETAFRESSFESTASSELTTTTHHDRVVGVDADADESVDVLVGDVSKVRVEQGSGSCDGGDLLGTSADIVSKFVLEDTVSKFASEDTVSKFASEDTLSKHDSAGQSDTLTVCVEDEDDVDVDGVLLESSVDSRKVSTSSSVMQVEAADGGLVVGVDGGDDMEGSTLGRGGVGSEQEEEEREVVLERVGEGQLVGCSDEEDRIAIQESEHEHQQQVPVPAVEDTHDDPDLPTDYSFSLSITDDESPSSLSHHEHEHPDPDFLPLPPNVCDANANEQTHIPTQTPTPPMSPRLTPLSSSSSHTTLLPPSPAVVPLALPPAPNSPSVSVSSSSSPARRPLPLQTRDLNVGGNGSPSAVVRPAWSIRASEAPALGLSAPRVKDVVGAGTGGSGKENTTASATISPLVLSKALPGSFFPADEDTADGVPNQKQDDDDGVQVHSPSKQEEESPVTGKAAVSAPVRFRANDDDGIRARHLRSPLDIALAMQLRPGLGLGADPAFLVRFLMAMFGWLTVLVGGEY